MKSVRELMSSPAIFCNQKENLKAVSNQMAVSNIGLMVVADEDQRVIGTVTDRDICVKLGETDKKPSATSVQEAMNINVFVVNADDDITRALRLMRAKKVLRLPVVDITRRLIGVISLKDILKGSVGKNDMDEIVFKGKESVVNAMVSIARRDEKVEYDEEFAEEE